MIDVAYNRYCLKIGSLSIFNISLNKDEYINHFLNYLNFLYFWHVMTIVRYRAPIKGLFHQVCHSELAAATASTTSEQRN